MTTLESGGVSLPKDQSQLSKLSDSEKPKVETSTSPSIRASTNPLSSGRMSQIWKAFSKMINPKESVQTNLLKSLYEIQSRCDRKIAACEAQGKLDFATIVAEIDSPEEFDRTNLLETFQQNTRLAERMLERQITRLKEEVAMLQGLPSTADYRALSSKNQQKVDVAIRASTEKANRALRDCENRRYQLDMRNGLGALSEFLNNQPSIVDEETFETVKVGPIIDATTLQIMEKMVYPNQEGSSLSLQELRLAKEALLNLKIYYEVQTIVEDSSIQISPAVEGQLKSLIKGIKEIERQQETCFLRELEGSSPEIKKVFTDLKKVIGIGAAIPIDQKMAIMAILKLDGFDGVAKLNEYLQCASDIKRERAELLMQHLGLEEDDDRLARKYYELFVKPFEQYKGQLSPDDGRNLVDFHRFAMVKVGIVASTLYAQFGKGRDCRIEGPYLAAGEKRLVERGYQLHEKYGMWKKESWEPSSDINLTSPFVVAWNGEFALKREDGTFALRQRRHIFDLSRFGPLTKEQKLLAMQFAHDYYSGSASLHADMKRAIEWNQVVFIPEKYRSLLIAPGEDLSILSSQDSEKILARYKALLEATESFAGQVSRSLVSSVMETPLSSLQGTPLFATYNLSKRDDYLNISGAFGVVPMSVDSIYKAILGEKGIAEDPNQSLFQQLKSSGMSDEQIHEKVEQMQQAEDAALGANLLKGAADVQEEVAARLPGSATVFALQEVGPGEDRPELQRLMQAGYKLIRPDNGKDTVIALDTKKFKNIENHSFLVTLKDGWNIEVAVAIATDAKRKDQVAFVSVHIPGFDVEREGEEERYIDAETGDTASAQIAKHLRTLCQGCDRVIVGGDFNASREIHDARFQPWKEAGFNIYSPEETTNVVHNPKLSRQLHERTLDHLLVWEKPQKAGETDKKPGLFDKMASVFKRHTGKPTKYVATTQGPLQPGSSPMTSYSDHTPAYLMELVSQVTKKSLST